MDTNWLERWNTRYSQADYAYGTEPNEFLKEQLPALDPGTILFGAEGEGRNAVFAATLGWEVSAFDISEAGQKKAQQLANAKGVNIDYQVGELPNLPFKTAPFDAIALIYAHFPADIRSSYHRMLDGLLKPGGTIIFEAFGSNHLAYRAKNERVGGPRDQASLFSVEGLQQDFPGYQVILLEEKEVQLQEGHYHQGTGSVVRFVGKK